MTNNHQPLVSVIIPAFNAEPYIEQAVGSVLGQEYRNLEILVVDDGSRDKTASLAKKLGGPKVRLLRQINCGAAAARNFGLKAAQGEFIQFLDGDDMLSPEKIARQAEALLENRDCVASCAWGRFYQGEAKAWFKPDVLWKDQDPTAFIALCRGEHLMMHPAAWLVPRQIAEAAGPWDERLTRDDDGEYFARVVLASRRILFVETAETYYRSGISTSLSKSVSTEAWESQFLSIDLTRQWLLQREDTPQNRRAIADCFQRLRYQTWPVAPSISRRAAQRVRELGGSPLAASGSRLFNLGKKLGGWRSGLLAEAYGRRVVGTIASRHPHRTGNASMEQRPIRTGTFSPANTEGGG